ncbi:DNA-binding domain protein [Vibrio phage 1.244.A._10N.261.54.C3]|nr:DNA-binding domain protein [Vibrio phage 1.244.A._10N.261.54.C3]AUR98707.1 DNA-binding domain protein [Vibrio phage 1.255.O._10N.286.45.F1]
MDMRGRSSRKVCGIGVNDVEHATYSKSFGVWSSMLTRCTSPKRYPSYVGVTVCDEWLTFSVFERWFDDNYIEGMSLDKDLMNVGSKQYSPRNCNFVPPSLNTLFHNHTPKNDGIPRGVIQSSKNSYSAYISKRGKNTHLGSFGCAEDAAVAVIEARRVYINEELKRCEGLGVNQKLIEVLRVRNNNV